MLERAIANSRSVHPSVTFVIHA